MRLHKKYDSDKKILQYFEKNFDLGVENSTNHPPQFQYFPQTWIDYASLLATEFVGFTANIGSKLTSKINHCMKASYWGNGERLTFESCKHRDVNRSLFLQYQTRGESKNEQPSRILQENVNEQPLQNLARECSGCRVHNVYQCKRANKMKNYYNSQRIRNERT